MSASPSFVLTRTPLELKFRTATLASREWRAPGYVRIRVQGEQLRGFTSLGSDDHMRLFFPEGVPASVDEMREGPSREYTPLAWGEDWLDIEFAIHGDEGIAAPWAATAPLGSTIGVGGPRGSMVIEGTPGGWLLVGDETAIPAITRFAALAGDAPTIIAVEVPSATHEVPMDAEVQWLHRGDAPAGSAIETFLAGLGDPVAADPFCFIAAEQSVVKPGRALLARWGVSPERAVVKGYWKRGEAEYHAPH